MVLCLYPFTIKQKDFVMYIPVLEVFRGNNKHTVRILDMHRNSHCVLKFPSKSCS